MDLRKYLDDNFLTASDLSSRLGVSVRTVEGWIYRSSVPVWAQKVLSSEKLSDFFLLDSEFISSVILNDDNSKISIGVSKIIRTDTNSFSIEFTDRSGFKILLNVVNSDF